jgi:hypothetical protein
MGKCKACFEQRRAVVPPEYSMRAPINGFRSFDGQRILLTVQ